MGEKVGVDDKNVDCFAEHTCILSTSKLLRAGGGGGGPKRPVLCDNEPQNTGVRSTQARGVVKTH